MHHPLQVSQPPTELPAPRWSERLIAALVCQFARLVTSVRAFWLGGPPRPGVRIYYANHRSHGDFVLIWASLPPELRARTRPVAGADYWLRGRLRRYVINQVFRGVLIDREAGRAADPVGTMAEALAGGDALIMFPEGTRNLGDELLPFRSGLYHLAHLRPELEIVPVWIENLGRAMPKGSVIPLPLLCSVIFGPALRLQPDEPRDAFLQRARDALIALSSHLHPDAP